jgi:hypothetical protein
VESGTSQHYHLVEDEMSRLSIQRLSIRLERDYVLESHEVTVFSWPPKVQCFSTGLREVKVDGEDEVEAAVTS